MHHVPRLKSDPLLTEVATFDTTTRDRIVRMNKFHLHHTYELEHPNSTTSKAKSVPTIELVFSFAKQKN